MELSGEYVGCDGEPQRLRVSCEASGDADPLQSLSAGVVRMKELVAEFFGTLVEQDAQGVAEDPDDALDGDDEDDAEDENNSGRTNSDGPSAKRPKPAS
uniref:GON7 subunit of KEOPS complex n=1 Tax=Mus spicilegus TaxID=10103 RepID=A0A8C6IJY8_MUSSI